MQTQTGLMFWLSFGCVVVVVVFEKKKELLCLCVRWVSHSLNSPVSDYSSCVSGVNERSVVHTILTASFHTTHLTNTPFCCLFSHWVSVRSQYNYGNRSFFSLAAVSSCHAFLFFFFFSIICWACYWRNRSLVWWRNLSCGVFLMKRQFRIDSC